MNCDLTNTLVHVLASCFSCPQGPGSSCCEKAVRANTQYAVQDLKSPDRVSWVSFSFRRKQIQFTELFIVWFSIPPFDYLHGLSLHKFKASSLRFEEVKPKAHSIPGVVLHWLYTGAWRSSIRDEAYFTSDNSPPIYWIVAENWHGKFPQQFCCCKTIPFACLYSPPFSTNLRWTAIRNLVPVFRNQNCQPYEC